MERLQVYTFLKFFYLKKRYNNIPIYRKSRLEAFAEKICTLKNWNNEFIESKEFDSLRNYVRFGTGKFWPYSMRKIYSDDSAFTDTLGNIKPKNYQILHEYRFLMIGNNSLIFGCIILGIEYSINIINRTIKDYLKWLKINDNLCPLSNKYETLAC